MQVCSRAVVVAMGVNADGRRELLGLKVGDSESEGFWSQFIGSLKERGLTGVKLVISDAHRGLTNAIRRMLQGSCWQRCRVHFARNLLERVNEEIKRRTRVVGIFPNDAAIERLVNAVLLEQDKHWQLEGRRMFSAESMAAIPALEELPTQSSLQDTTA